MNSSTPSSHTSPRRKIDSRSFGTSTENVRLAIPRVDLLASDDISSSISLVLACDMNPSSVSMLAYRNSTALLNDASSAWRLASSSFTEDVTEVGSSEVSMDPALPQTGPRTMYWSDQALSTTSDICSALEFSGRLKSVRVCGTAMVDAEAEAEAEAEVVTVARRSGPPVRRRSIGRRSTSRWRSQRADPRRQGPRSENAGDTMETQREIKH